MRSDKWIAILLRKFSGRTARGAEVEVQMSPQRGGLKFRRAHSVEVVSEVEVVRDEEFFHTKTAPAATSAAATAGSVTRRPRS